LRRLRAVVGLPRIIAHDLGGAAAVLDDLHAVAELDVAVVALGDGDALAIVLLDGDLDAAAAAADAVAVDDRAGDRATDSADRTADQSAADAAAARGADRDATQAAQQAADDRAVSAPAASTASAQADVIDRHDPPGFAGLGIAVGLRRGAAATRGRIHDPRLNAIIGARAKPPCQKDWQQGRPN